MKRFVPLAALAMLSACAASPASTQSANLLTQNYLATKAYCERGEASACTQLPMAYQAAVGAQQQVAAEQQANTATAGAIGLGVLAVGLGVLDAATCCSYGYHYHYTPYRWRHW